ncbi:NlpC/P60 family protein [uncultured Arthrobacter sp.]|uniref:NlpC/P60 family protein n=1 Tax=uncultured Arthrobacter sp. TaxID=114050 RepID=UPI002609F80F|nr:NlpC/P60 family protein [uncultured Arthrobacter sp.]
MGRQAAVIVAASGLVLTAGLPAHGASEAQRSAQAVKTLSAVAAQPTTVSASADAAVTFERAAVETVAAPVVEAAPATPAVTEQAEAVQAAPVAPAAAPAAPAAVAEPAAEVAAASQAEVAAASQAEVAVEAVEAPAPVEKPASSGIGAALVGSAYSQIGAVQDCTVLVEVALRSIGKSVGDLGPEQFYAYGDVVATPQPGDLVIRPGHVAIYVGNGQVISSGMNGVNATILHPLSDLAGSSFVRVS